MTVPFNTEPTAFYMLPDGRLFSVARRVNVGLKEWMLVGYAEHDPYVHYVIEQEAKPMPGAPMPRLRLVDAGDA